ncbi:nucleoside hydrolase [Abortiporus biennis]|nr:nucleoside hydrolase [Abortiporus biennis]
MGHDDATAILLALHWPDIELLGVSTVHGNTSADNTNLNAARCLEAFGAPEHIKVHAGARKPLIRLPHHDVEIHGVGGLGGVEGLPPKDDERVLARFDHPGGNTRAIDAIARAVQRSWQDGQGTKISVVSTGPMTNIALFVSVYPELLEGVEQFVFMGGGVGVGNRSAAAEFNILCDPEAAQIVLDAPVKCVMVPLNVTHTAIVEDSIHAKILSPNSALDNGKLPPAATPLRQMLSTLITFFAEAYKAVFGFHLGPPLHDALTIAYIAQPELFTCRRFRVDVELSGKHTSGETVVDLWDYSKSDTTWGHTGKNCIVTEALDVMDFFDKLLECITRCDSVSPLNRKS